MTLPSPRNPLRTAIRRPKTALFLGLLVLGAACLKRPPAASPTSEEAKPSGEPTTTTLQAMQAEPSAADIVAPDGIIYPDFSRAGIPGGIPKVDVVADATKHGAVPDDGQDDSAAIQKAIDSAGERGGGAVLLPKGTYHLDETVRLHRDGVVLRGAGREQTRLEPRFRNHSSNESIAAIAMKPAEDRGSWHKRHLTEPTSRGDTVITVDGTSGIEQGDVVVLVARPPADVVATLSEPLQKLSASGYGESYSHQHLLVVSTTDDTVTFDRPVRLNLSLKQRPHLRPMEPLRRAGVEDLTIAQVVKNKHIHGITMKSTHQSWVRGVSVLRIGNWPIVTDRSFEFEHRDLLLDESLSRGGGGVAYYGFSFSTDGLIDNVKVTRLRHLSVQIASNGNVFRNSYFENVDINFHLIWPYENLFENCHADSTIGPEPEPDEKGRGSYGFAVYTPRHDGEIHLPAGPRNTFYANHFVSSKEGVALGGGAAFRTIFAYNRFDVQNGAGAVIQQGSDGSIFSHNTFLLRDFLRVSREEFLPETESDRTPEALAAAVMLPDGPVPGLRFLGNTFYAVPSDRLFTGGTPAVGKENRAVNEEPFTPRLPRQDVVPLAGPWKVKSARRLPPAPSPDKRHQDPGISTRTKALMAPNVEDSGWKEYLVPGPIEQVEGWDDFDGEFVMRRTIEVPEKMAGQELELSLGAIDDHDVTWVNGKKVGQTQGKDAWKKPRLYRVPAELVQAGTNVITVRVWDMFGGGGVSALRSDLYLGPPEATSSAESGLIKLVPKPKPPVESLFLWQREHRSRKKH